MSWLRTILALGARLLHDDRLPHVQVVEAPAACVDCGRRLVVRVRYGDTVGACTKVQIEADVCLHLPQTLAVVLPAACARTAGAIAESVTEPRRDARGRFTKGEPR